MRTLLIQSNSVVLLDGDAAISERVTERLRFVVGEWFLDATAGVPYYTALLGRNASAELVGVELANEAREIEGVANVRVRSVSLSRATNVLDISLAIETINGESDLEIEIGAD